MFFLLVGAISSFSSEHSEGYDVMFNINKEGLVGIDFLENLYDLFLKRSSLNRYYSLCLLIDCLLLSSLRGLSYSADILTTDTFLLKAGATMFM